MRDIQPKEPFHHTRYRKAWEEYKVCVDPVCKKALEKEMDSAQDYFNFEEFQIFKKTLPGFMEYWGYLVTDAKNKLKETQE